MIRRLLSLFLAFVTILSLLPTAAFAASSEEDALGEVDIYNGDYELGYLAINGTVRKQKYTYFLYESNDGSTKESPAYCVNPNQYGVPQTVGPGESIKYLAEEKASDPKVVGIISNGYPHRSLGELGLENKYQAFYATKMALWCYLIPSWDISNLKVAPGLSGSELDIGNRILAAAKDIYKRGTTYNYMLTPRMTVTADKSTAYPVTIDGQAYLQQVFTVWSETWVYDYDVSVAFSDPDSVDSVPEGTKIVDANNKEITAVTTKYTSDGYAWFEGLTESGRYYLRELENEGYIPDTQLRTVYVKAGETTEVTWENTPITGQIQITKRSADYNPTTGLPAGTPLEGAIFEIYDKSGNLVDTIRSNSRGLAVSKQLPLSRYTIREVKAPEHYGVNETELTAYLEYEGQIVRFEVTNKSLTTGVSITKTGPKEIMGGQPVRYTFSGIANTSNVRLDSFYWRDTIPAQVRLDTVITGTYNFPGTYKITYRVNGGEYRTLADNLSTSQTYTLAASPAALGLAANERVTEIMFVFGQAPAGFAQVETPYLNCTAVANLPANSSFVNIADVGGVYNGTWVQAISRWVTTVYGKPDPLPRTGY